MFSPTTRSNSDDAHGTVTVGIGYRRELHDALVVDAPTPGAETDEVIDFLEVAPENYLGIGGSRRRQLQAVAGRWPLVTHGLAMSLAGPAALDMTYLQQVSEFVSQVGSPWHSDHLCVSLAGGSHTHELLPAEYSKENAARVAHRIKVVQSVLDVPFIVENVSAYGRRRGDTMAEVDFISEVVDATGCGLLLDVNNVFVNAHNFGLDPYEMLRRLPLEQTLQIHIAGHHRESPELLIDTHGEPIAAPVYELLATALERTGPVPVLIERDHDIPPLSELLVEVGRVRSVANAVFGQSTPLPAGIEVSHAFA